LQIIGIEGKRKADILRNVWNFSTYKHNVIIRERFKMSDAKAQS